MHQLIILFLFIARFNAATINAQESPASHALWSFDSLEKMHASEPGSVRNIIPAIPEKRLISLAPSWDLKTYQTNHSIN